MARVKLDEAMWKIWCIELLPEQADATYHICGMQFLISFREQQNAAACCHPSANTSESVHDNDGLPTAVEAGAAGGRSSVSSARYCKTLPRWDQMSFEPYLR